MRHRHTVWFFQQLIDRDEDLQLLTVEQVSRKYKISDRTLKRHIAAGRLRAVRVGRRYCVTVSNLKRYFNGGKDG